MTVRAARPSSTAAQAHTNGLYFLQIAEIEVLAGLGWSRTLMQLDWTATGDDGNTGTASVYDIRYSTSPITGMGDFLAATPVANLPTPKPAGSAEQIRVSGLTPGQLYYFAMTVEDDGGNGSGLSNVASRSTPP